MKVQAKSPEAAPNYYYGKEYRAIAQGCLDYILNHKETTSIDVEPLRVQQYNRNFYSLLFRMQIKPAVHWLTMRLSGLYHPSEDFSELTQIVVPTSTIMRQIGAPFKTTGVVKI